MCIPVKDRIAVFAIQGDIGPFNASLPTEVPLWVAIFLKQRRKCRIQPPDWMDVGKRRSSMQAILSYCAVISFKARTCARQTLRLCPAGDDTYVKVMGMLVLEFLKP